MYYHKHLVSKLPRLINKYPDILWSKALDTVQIDSKLWMLDKLFENRIRDLGNVMILGGWIGLLGHFLLESKRFKINCVRSFDIDPSSIWVADYLNKEYETDGWKFKSSYGDWNLLDFKETHYQTHRLSDNSVADCVTKFDTIINSCCEHMEHFSEWIKRLPENRLLVLQSSSDESQTDHIHCFPNLEEFIAATRLKKIIYSGTLKLRSFDRFMIIGYK
jgi:hypothetical protein